MQETGNKNISKIDFISSSFSPECSMSYNISIRELPNGFCLCVYDYCKNECVAIKTIDTWDEDEILTSLKYNKVISIKQSIFTLIPKTLADEDNINTLFIAEKHQKHRFKTNTNIIDNNTLIAFDTKKFIKISNNDIYIHPITALAYTADNINLSNITIAEQDGENINIIVKINNKIILANSFAYTCTEDAAYYILATYQQLNLDVMLHKTYLCGNINHIKNTKTFISEYINEVKITSQNTNIHWDNNFPKELYPIFAIQLQNK